MASLKSRIVAFILKNTRKKAFASPENLHAWLDWSRPRRNHRPPPRLSRKVEIAERRIGDMPVYEVTPRDGVAGPERILYMHGGAYCFEITPYHWRLIAEMAIRLEAQVTVPIYPLAPEYTFHDIFAPVKWLYEGMLDEVEAENITFMGDSAGGNMALVLTMMAAGENRPGPGRLVLISPGVDMSLTNPDIFEAAKLDPWLAIPGGIEAVRLYAPEMERTDWRISPIFGDLSVLPKTLMFSGTRDVLSADCVVFAKKAEAAGVDIELVLEPDMIHVWPLIDMPEARTARDRIVAFCRPMGMPPAVTTRSLSTASPS